MQETESLERRSGQPPERSQAEAGERGMSMRTKGHIMFGAVVGYALLVAVFVFLQKGVLLREFDAIHEAQDANVLLAQSAVAAQHAAAVAANASAPDQRTAIRRIDGHHALLRSRLEALRELKPDIRAGLAHLQQELDEARARPEQADMAALADAFTRVNDALAAEVERARQAGLDAASLYRSKTDALAVMTLVLGMAGLGLLGAIPGVFFKHLTADLHALQTRALEIMRGYRGAPLHTRRRDEVGQLMKAVNSMASTLEQREKELAVERQKVFHQEKMAAIGTLAAGVAHEIGNPIAAMSGMLQELSERPHVCADGMPCDRCRFDLIQTQIERLAAITRDISGFAAPGAAEPQLLDLNAQVTVTAGLLRYDRRMQEVGLALELDPRLPAVHGIPDQLIQVIMNLLINAVDALEGRPQPRVLLRTRLDDEYACLDVIDNGPGMPPEVRAQAFEAFFTTKPAGKGTGLGLSLCYAILQAHGGGIEIEPEDGGGTRVRVTLPIAA